MTPEILAIDPGFPGAGRVLKELGRSSEKVRYIGPELVPGDVHEKWAILPAWNPDYPELINRLRPFAQVCILWTSPCLQTEMVPQELEYVHLVRHLLREKKIGAVWVGDDAWLTFFKDHGRAFCAPYPATLPEAFREKPRERSAGVPIQASLLGPMHPRKNVLVQALAAKLAGCVLHYNDEKAGEIIDLSGVKFDSLQWMPEKLYGRLILEMDIGLQVSVPGVESFSYVAWDHISRGVPCLSSAWWVPAGLRPMRPFDPMHIAHEIHRNVAWPGDLRTWATEVSTTNQKELFRELEQNLGVSL